MKKKLTILIIIIMLTAGYVYNEQNVAKIKQLREETLKKSTGINHGYVFKVYNLESRSTYKFECWSEHYQNGQLNDKIEILGKPQVFVTANKSSIGYIILDLNEASDFLEFTLSRDINKNDTLVSGYKKESFKFKGVITALKEMKISQNNEMLLLASAYGENASSGIPINQGKELIEDGIKKNDEVYLIKCKLIKVQ